MNVPLLNRLSRKQRKLLFWIAGLVLLYTVVGFLILPPIIRSVAAKQLSEQLGREVTIQQVKLNPFAFSATVRGLLIKEKSGDPFVSWDEVYVNFRPTSVFQHPWILKEVSTSRPFIHVQVNSNGSFNFSDILAKFSTNAPPPKVSKAPPKQLAVRIDQINIGSAILDLKREPQIASANALAPQSNRGIQSTNTYGPTSTTQLLPLPKGEGRGEGEVGTTFSQTSLQNPTNAENSILLLLQSVTNGFAALSQITNSFAACVNSLSISNFTVKLEDLANPRPARLTLDQIAVNGTNLSNVPLTNFAANLALRWNTNGALKTEITGSLGKPAVDIHLAFANIELHPLDPYLDSRLSVFIIGSKLGMDGQIRLRGSDGGLPQVTFTGETWLNDFHTVDGVLDEDLLKWKSVHISGIDAGLNPPEVAIKQMAVTEPYARIIIETNRTINLLVALHISMTNGAANATAEAAAPTSTEKARKMLAGERVISTNALAELPIRKLSIGSIVISNASANFTDRSLTPNVNMAIQQISGTISGISSEELQHADVDLRAKVDNVGPVAITGVINPFSKDQTNEIKIALNDMDLTPLSPYSGKYAGYRIAKGKLNVAMAYHLHGRELKSENVITIDQFTFGEKVNSPDATRLPVRLGIAILKDRSGKIVLDVPIEGSLDDPQFRLHKVITRAVWNIVEKAITKPFAVLGALFGGGKGEEISYQDFGAGSADLTPGSKEKLDVIVKALYERPGLQLEISGSVDTNADTSGLRALMLEKQLRAQKWQALRKADRATITPDRIVISPEERPDLIKTLYADAFSKGLMVTSSTANARATKGRAVPVAFSKTPDTQRGATELLHRESTPTPTPTPVNLQQSPATTVTDPFELALLNNISVSDDDFQTLSANRAKAVRDYILQSGKVEAGRVFLTENKNAGLKTEGPRVYLELQ